VRILIVDDEINETHPDTPIVLISNFDDQGVEKTREAVREAVQLVNEEHAKAVSVSLRSVIQQIRTLRNTDASNAGNA